MLKIFFIPGAYDGCYYYRGYLPAIYGQMTCVTNFVGGFDNDELHKRALESDVVVFQRPNDSTRVDLMRALKQKGKFIVFENDDTYLPDKGVPLNQLGSDKAREIAIALSKNIEKALNIADLVIASTDMLANEYRQTTKTPVVVRKNCVDPLDEFTRTVPTTLSRSSGRPRIGFVGSVASNDDYTHIIPMIRALEDKVTFVVLGNKKGARGFEEDDSFWDTIKNVEWHEFVPMTRYHKKLADLNLHIAIIPRKDNYFNRCKSNIKFLELSLQRIPVIAQGFSTKDSPYQFGKDKKYMTVVTKDDDWLPAVENVINNYTEYATLAGKAHDYVLEEYNIRKYAKDWRNIIEQHYANRQRTT